MNTSKKYCCVGRFAGRRRDRGGRAGLTTDERQCLNFVIHAFTRRIVGWRVSRSLRSDLALDALERAIRERQDEAMEALIHHSDRGVQYRSIRYTQRLAEAGIIGL